MSSSAIGQFVIGESPIGGQLFPASPGALKFIIPAYLYQQYSDDPDLTALVSAWNQIAQDYLDWFNANALAYYPEISGTLLDWVGQGIYGYPRPFFPVAGTAAVGPFATEVFGGGSTYAGYTPGSSGSQYQTSDDVYCRALAWHVWKGDGRYFNVRWLKRRVARFLTQAFGIGDVDNTYFVSVKFGTFPNVTILVLNDDPIDFDPNVLNALNEGIQSGSLETPFQFVFNAPVFTLYELTDDTATYVLTDDAGIYILTNEP